MVRGAGSCYDGTGGPATGVAWSDAHSSGPAVPGEEPPALTRVRGRGDRGDHPIFQAADNKGESAVAPPYGYQPQLLTGSIGANAVPTLLDADPQGHYPIADGPPVG